jgi:hypothetical protein
MVASSACGATFSGVTTGSGVGPTFGSDASSHSTVARTGPASGCFSRHFITSAFTSSGTSGASSRSSGGFSRMCFTMRSMDSLPPNGGRPAIAWQHTERVDVGARVRFVAGLLGRHVQRRAKEHPGPRQLGLVQRLRAIGREALHQAEVEHLPHERAVLGLGHGSPAARNRRRGWPSCHVRARPPSGASVEEPQCPGRGPPEVDEPPPGERLR